LQVPVFRIAHFDTYGFVVMRGFLDPGELAAEFEASMRDGFADPHHMNTGSAGNQFR
jgi:hypothetical protein